MNERDQRIAIKIKEIEDSLGLDWRFSYHALRGVRPGETGIELSSAEVFRALLEESHGRERTGGGSFLLDYGGVRARVSLLVPPVDTALWVMSSVADIRKSPDHASELLNQMIMGESAERLKEEGEWYLVRLPDGYIGWLRSWYVRESAREGIASYMSRAGARVEANVAYVRSSPGDKGLPVSDIVAGSRIIAGPAAAGYRSVLLPGERNGYLREAELGAEGSAPSREGIINRAKGYMGIPYLWGGTSPKGFDCSGLVKRVFGMECIELPRDTDRQALAGEEADARAVRPGDLLFFGEGETVSHVAIALGEERFIHAYGEVRINSLDPGDPLYEPKLAGSLRFARVILP
jgi:cell wall-associated NlpC family hydrolase